jgi:argininosuccinate lyase
MHIENRLGQILGPVASKLHTGRSRNDQVALDMRIYLKDETLAVISGLLSFRRVLVEFARKNLDVVMPGYTHTQRAQPVLFSHHLMAYYEMFSRDSGRFSDALCRMDEMPLGSAALAGTTFPLDMEHTARLLGFSRISKNSMDAVSDRDFILEFLCAASITMVHLSRLAEEIVLFSSAEFGFLSLPDEFTTGSSIMPQKKNPDVAELVRGKSGRVFGDLVSLLTVMKALPLSYNRDMQEDKLPLFDAVDTLKICLAVMTRMLPRSSVNAEKMREACSRGCLTATDMADYLVGKGVSFREAHRMVGRAVAHSLKAKKELQDLSMDELKKFSPAVDEDIYDWLDVCRSVNRRRSAGGTARASVRAAIGRGLAQLNRELKRGRP